ENCFRGKIQEISKTNFHLNLTIRAGGLAFYAIWPEQMVAHLGLEVGSEVEFGFRAKDVNLFSG
ncbi:MAG: molybdenum-dependent transcriptional regulator, partial [Thermodesulfobacteria bacterium]|nr:molybdenum-dependent transcriptional regulator [Thermodesulfobacteriota bacterium]